MPFVLSGAHFIYTGRSRHGSRKAIEFMLSGFYRALLGYQMKCWFSCRRCKGSHFFGVAETCWCIIVCWKSKTIVCVIGCFVEAICVLFTNHIKSCMCRGWHWKQRGNPSKRVWSFSRRWHRIGTSSFPLCTQGRSIFNEIFIWNGGCLWSWV